MKDEDGLIKAGYFGIIKSYLNFIKLGDPDLVDESLEPFEDWWNEHTSDETGAFIEEVYEIAFGDDAINRGFDKEEVLEKLRGFSDNALKYEEGEV
tara:strand:+ start:4114 stop:4401 length:288 start_codon:yes stop_codon:yes gene_type:complete